MEEMLANSMQVYDAAQYDINTSPRYYCLSSHNGPLMTRHLLKKYMKQPQHPIAKFLKGKGRKYFDIEDQSNVQKIKICVW